MTRYRVFLNFGDGCGGPGHASRVVTTDWRAVVVRAARDGFLDAWRVIDADTRRHVARSSVGLGRRFARIRRAA